MRRIKNKNCLHLKKYLTAFFIMLLLLPSAYIMAQNVQEIKGTVTDSKGSPATGVTVQVRGKNIGTQTDANGRFTIKAPSNAVIDFSAIGFVAQEMKVGNNTTLNVQLQNA